MTEEIDKHVLKKYEIQQKLGKGVRRAPVPEAKDLYICVSVCLCVYICTFYLFFIFICSGMY